MIYTFGKEWHKNIGKETVGNDQELMHSEPKSKPKIEVRKNNDHFNSVYNFKKLIGRNDFFFSV